MKILHIISNDNDRARTERVIRLMPAEFQHQFVTSKEMAQYQGHVDVIHAHQWFECGETAAKYASTKNVPYIVDVVQADLQKFRKSLFGRQSAEKILSEASRVVFTAPIQEDVLAQHLPSKTADTVFFHSMMLFEALDPFWIENLHIHPPTALVHIKLLYVGPSDSHHHLDVVNHAMKKLQRRNYDVTLTTVGDLSKEEMLEVYRSHDILLQLDEKTPSTQHFAEALSQGLPVIYAHSSIADGIFKEGQAGYAVNFSSTDEIARTILNISNFFGTIEQEIMRLHPLCQFDAKEQTRHWVHLYENAALSTTIDH